MNQDVSVTTLPPEQGNRNRTMFGCRWIARRVSSCWTPDSVVVLKIPYGRRRRQGERWQVESKIRNFGVNDTIIRNFYDTNFSREFLHFDDSNWILILTRSLLQPSVQPSTFAWFSRAKEWCFDNCRRFYQTQGVLVMAPVIWSQKFGGKKAKLQLDLNQSINQSPVNKLRYVFYCFPYIL